MNIKKLGIATSKKSLTRSLAIALAAFGVAWVPAQSSQAESLPEAAAKCVKTGTSSSGGDSWICHNVFGYAYCHVSSDGSYLCEGTSTTRESHRDDITGNIYDERDPLARHLLRLVHRDTRG